MRTPILVTATVLASLLLPSPRAAATDSARFAWPTSVSANGQVGRPYLISGDSPQGPFVMMSQEQAEDFFADHQAGGFNALWINSLVPPYYPTYAQVLKEHNRENPPPTYLVEANYEDEDTGPKTLRRQEYWTMTSGATGQLYGSGWTWQFRPGWESHVDTQGTREFKRLAFFG